MLGRQKKKKQTHYFKPFITCINISTEINKGCWACLEDSCSLLRLACLERVGALGMPSIPAPSKTPPSLFNHPLRAGGTAGAVKVSSFHGRGWICCKNWGAIDGSRQTKMSVAFELEVSFFEAVMLQIKWSFLLKITPAEGKNETTQDYKYSSNKIRSWRSENQKELSQTDVIQNTWEHFLPTEGDSDRKRFNLTAKPTHQNSLLRGKGELPKKVHEQMWHQVVTWPVCTTKHSGTGV